MTLPFHADATIEFPLSIVHFLSLSDLGQFSRVNRTMYDRVKEKLKIRKNEMVDQLIYYFYYANPYDITHKTFSIRRRYTDNYYQNVRLLFHVLPELFAFIEAKQITRLDLGCTTDYGGYPESPYKMIHSDFIEVSRIGKQVLDLLSHNTTLIHCNLGLFHGTFMRKSIIEAVENHPTLDTLNMVSSGARTNFHGTPHILWRNLTDRSFYWNHFRQDDSIN